MAISVSRKSEAPAAAMGWGNVPKTNGFAKAKQITEERKMESALPFDFYLRNDGDKAEYIILDDVDGESAFFAWTHRVPVWNNGKQTYERVFCPREFQPGCPICARGVKERPTYTMFLTIADMRPVPRKEKDGSPMVDKQGNPVVYPWTRRLMEVPPTAMAHFERAVTKHGTLRGVQMEAIRVAKGPRIGIPSEIGFADSEEELLAVLPDPEYRDKDGKVIRGEGERLKAIDYRNVFPRPTVEGLVAKFGGSHTPGSGAYNAQQASAAKAEAPPADDGYKAPTPPADTVDDDSDIPF